MRKPVKKKRIGAISPTQRATTVKPAPNDSRFDFWTQSEGAEARAEFNWFNEFRTPKISTASLTKLPSRLDIDIVQKYNLRTIDFGNWVTQFHRQNFNALLNVSFADLAKLVGTDNLGKGELTVDWGGRGQRRALGLYKSWVKVINLRRHERLDKLLKKVNSSQSNYIINNYTELSSGHKGGSNYTLNKKGVVWLLGTSGFGSFAHEFGHFLDNVIYEKTKPQFKSNGFMTGDAVLPLSSPTSPKGEIPESEIIYHLFGYGGIGFGYFNYDLKFLNNDELAFANVFIKTYYKGKFSSFFNTTMYTPNDNLKRIEKYCKDSGGKYEYWGSFIECWARIFEGWVQYSLNKKGIQNNFLVTPEKKFEVSSKIIDGKEITVAQGRLVYPNTTTYPKINKDILAIMNIFATIK